MADFSPVDFEGDPDLPTATHIVIAKRYERCLEEGLTEEAERIQNAPTIQRQKQIAGEVAKEHFNND